jgi:hypothetical protein
MIGSTSPWVKNKRIDRTERRKKSSVQSAVLKSSVDTTFESTYGQRHQISRSTMERRFKSRIPLPSRGQEQKQNNRQRQDSNLRPRRDLISEVWNIRVKRSNHFATLPGAELLEFDGGRMMKVFRKTRLILNRLEIDGAKVASPRRSR